MGSSKSFDTLATIFLNGGGDIGNEAGVRTVFFRLRWHLSSVFFPSSSMPCPHRPCPLFFLISKKSLPALARSATKFSTRVMLSGGMGGSDNLPLVWPVRKLLTDQRKPPLQHLSHLRQRIFFCLIMKPRTQTYCQINTQFFLFSTSPCM